MACAAAGIAVVALASAASAQECITIAAYEWRGEAASADPADIVAIDDSMRATAMYEGLTAMDNGYQPQPMLAESWQADDDATEWTFHLRPGVTFHDGSELDSGDVVYTFRRLMDPATQSGAAAILSFLKPENITATDPLTVVFKVDRPTVELPLQITQKFGGIIPEGTTREMLQSRSLGTGPFMMESFTPGAVKNVLARNPNYWQAGLPKAECLEFVPINEAVSRAAALMSGEVDLLPVVDPATIVTLRENPDITLEQSPGGTVMTLSMWVDTPPFDDVRVRQAMKLVVDREQMVQTALFGAGIPGNDNPIAPTSPDAYRGDIIPRDVEKAKALLAEAGYPDGLDIELYTAEAFPGMVNIAEAYAQMAADAGIRVSVIKTPAEGYWDDVWLKKSFLTSSWGGRAPAEGLSIAYHSKAQWPETHWFRADFDALLDKASATPDPAERRAVYQEAQRLLAEEGGVIVPGFLPTVSALRKGCSGYVPNNNVNYQDYRDLTCG
jgi:peptide/nickel transport system substrate-binding protein